MAIEKRKVIVALIPFIITTIGVLIFVIFFNFGHITFHGTGPYTLTLNGREYTADSKGDITAEVRTGEYEAEVRKDGFVTQKVVSDVGWKGNTIVQLNFTYKPVSQESDFTPTISYQAGASVQDNQTTDLVFDTIGSKTITIPGNSTDSRVVWAHDGGQACIFTPQNPAALTAMLWQKGSISSLPKNVFDCFAGQNGLLEASFHDSTIFVEEQAIKKDPSTEFSLQLNTTAAYALLTEKQSTGTEQAEIFDFKNKKLLDLGKFEPTQKPQFIGPRTVALVQNNTIKIYHAPFTKSIDLPVAVDLHTVVYAEQSDTFYFVDTVNNSSLSWNGLVNSENDTYTALFAYHPGESAQELLQLGTDISFSHMQLSADERTILLFSADNKHITRIKLAP